MKENLELPFYYYRSAKALYYLFIPFPAIIFLPIFVMTIKPSLFQSIEPYFILIIGVAILLSLLGMIAIFVRKLKPLDGIFHLSGEKIIFKNKIIDLSRSSISFGNFGNAASGARGTILYLQEENDLIKIAVMGFYLESPYKYREDWSLKADAFLTKENFQTFILYLDEEIEKTIPTTFSSTKSLEIQLRKPLSTGQTSKFMFLILFPAVILAAMLGQFSPVFSILVILGMVGTFIYLMIKASKKPGGYDIIVEEDRISLYTVNKKSLNAHNKLSDINYSLYQIQIPTKYTRYGYEVLKIMFHNGKGITIATFLGTAPINRRQSFLEDLKYSFQGPEFMVDEVNFKRITEVIIKK